MLSVPMQVVAQAVVAWWDDLVNLAVINIAWILCWLTIVLGPPATFGLFDVAHELASGRSLGLKGLIDGGKQYFIKSWEWMLVNLGVFILLVVNVLFYGSIDRSWADFLPITMIVLGAAWLVVQFYAIPYLILQEQKSLWTAWRNGLFTVLASPAYTLVLIILVVLIAAVCVFTVLPLVLGGPALIAVLGSFAVLERVETFRAIKKKDEEQRENQD